MAGIATPEHNFAAGRLRAMLSIYQENQDLISIGAYKGGSNPELDEAMRHIDQINKLLQQAVDVKVDFNDTIQMMLDIIK